MTRDTRTSRSRTKSASARTLYESSWKAAEKTWRNMKVDTSSRQARDAHTMPPFALSFFHGGGEMIIYVMERTRYGFFHFIFDCVMTLITCGLWLIWVF